jgi:hypothetical protein
MAEAGEKDNTYRAAGDLAPVRHMTACEVLTWIGYRRAIPAQLYFAPLHNASPAATAAQLAALLHAEVPAPKPAECPMPGAERLLMAALRSGQVRALATKNRRLEELPREIYEYAVAVSARGGLEADMLATPADSFRALDYLSSIPPIGPVLFSTQEILAAWPAAPAEAAVAVAHNPRGPRPRETDRAAAQMATDYVGDPGALRGEKQQALADKYSVSRSTAERARTAALQDLANRKKLQQNSNKTPTIDN